MAEPLDDFKKQQKELKESFQDLVTTFQDTMVGLSASTSQAFKQAIQQTSNDIDKQAQRIAKANISSAFKSAAEAATDLGKVIDDNNNKSLDSRSITLKRESLETKLNNLYRAREIAIRNGVDLSAEELANLEDIEEAIVNASKEEEKRSKNLEERLGILGTLLRETQKIPLVGELLDADEILLAMSDKMRDSNSSMAALGAGGVQAFKSIGTAIKVNLLPLLILSSVLKTLQFIAKGFFIANERSVTLARTLGVSKDQAQILRENLEAARVDIAKSYITTGDLVEAQVALNEQLQRTGTFNQDNLEAQTFLTRRLGLASETALLLIARSEAFGQSATNNFDTILELNNQLLNTGESTGTINQIMEEVASASGQVAASFGFSNTELAQAVIKVRQFGFNLSQARSISEGLLDFERSIGAELEAELLLGRELNLNRARSLAAVGDIDDATALVMDQMKGLTDEQRKSPIIMSALADVLSLSVDELQDAYLLETDRARQGLEQLKNYEKYKKEVAAVNKLENISKRQRQKELDDLADKYNLTSTTRAELEKNVTAQQRFNEILSEVQEKFADFVGDGGLDTLTDMIDNLSNALARLEKGGIFSLIFGGREPIVKVTAERDENNQLTGISTIEESDDFIIRPGQPVQKFRKDDIVIGGTNLSGGNNKNVEGLLERIASAIESGGDVYIDGNKAGRAMVLASHKLS